MKSNPAAELAHSQKLEENLAPLDFEAVRPGVFAQRKHPFIHFDLTAINPVPDVAIPYVMDQLWDVAIQEGRRRQNEDIKGNRIIRLNGIIPCSSAKSVP